MMYVCARMHVSCICVCVRVCGVRFFVKSYCYCLAVTNRHIVCTLFELLFSKNFGDVSYVSKPPFE